MPHDSTSTNVHAAPGMQVPFVESIKDNTCKQWLRQETEVCRQQVSLQSVEGFHGSTSVASLQSSHPTTNCSICDLNKYHGNLNCGKQHEKAEDNQEALLLLHKRVQWCWCSLLRCTSKHDPIQHVQQARLTASSGQQQSGSQLGPC